MRPVAKVLLVGALLVAMTAGLAVAQAVLVTVDCSKDPGARCNGTDGQEEILGEDEGRDVIRAMAEVDDVSAGGGNDYIDAGDGDDGGLAESLYAVEGGDGRDTVFGGEGDDHLDGQGGADTIHGSPGIDVLHGDGGVGDSAEGDGDDVIMGGEGDDEEIDGYEGSNTLHGGAGNDEIASGSGNTDEISGGPGDDNVVANDGVKDVINCGPGDDTVTFDEGIDVLDASCEEGGRAPVSGTSTPTE